MLFYCYAQRWFNCSRLYGLYWFGEYLDMSMLWILLLAAIPLVILAMFSGALLGFAEVRFKVEGNPIADQLNDILPQTQCGQCGYPGCRDRKSTRLNSS